MLNYITVVIILIFLKIKYDKTKLSYIAYCNVLTVDNDYVHTTVAVQLFCRNQPATNRMQSSYHCSVYVTGLEHVYTVCAKTLPMARKNCVIVVTIELTTIAYSQATRRPN